jgi:ribosomal protein S3
MLYRMSFWKYRTLFRYLKFVIKDLFEPNFKKFGLRGFKVKLKGKISVAGNARTRTLLMRVGQTSHSKFNNKVAHSFTLVNSFTGVMGFNVWIFF